MPYNRIHNTLATLTEVNPDLEESARQQVLRGVDFQSMLARRLTVLAYRVSCV
jgi:hypothetical protein